MVSLAMRGMVAVGMPPLPACSSITSLPPAPSSVPVKLAERPGRDARPGTDDRQPLPSAARGNPLGLLVRDVDRDLVARFHLPEGLQGVIVSRVEPLSPAFDADIERGHVILEVNRQPVRTIEDFRRLTGAARSGDVFTFYLYKPELDGGQRALHTVRVD